VLKFETKFAGSPGALVSAQNLIFIVSTSPFGAATLIEAGAASPSPFAPTR
jgi:hypothetical protein